MTFAYHPRQRMSDRSAQRHFGPQASRPNDTSVQTGRPKIKDTSVYLKDISAQAKRNVLNYFYLNVHLGKILYINEKRKRINEKKEDY